MCILVNAVKRQPLELSLEGRISNALVEVGPSITLASLSEVLAFAVGSFIPMPACRVFSMFAGWKFCSFKLLYLWNSFNTWLLSFCLTSGLFYKLTFVHSSAALAVLLDFLLQVTAFVALIVFDFRRTEDKRVDCFPCMKISSYTNSDKGIRIFLELTSGWCIILVAHTNFQHMIFLSIIYLFIKIYIISIWMLSYLGIDQRKPGLLTRYMKVTTSFLFPYFLFFWIFVLL